MSLSIAVVQGGPSTEAEVSRASAKGVAGALTQAGHKPHCLELDAHLPEALRTGRFDVVFPVVHGAFGEDGCLQGVLEILGLPYVGSDLAASVLAMHKRLSRTLFERAGLPVAKGIAVARRAVSASRAAERARREVGTRLVVKPSAHGSALGVTRLEESASPDDVARAIEAAWAMDDVAIVEHFARGREVTCGVLELEAPTAFAPTEIFSPKDPFYTYEARYAPGRSVHVCPAELSAPVVARVQAVAVAAHEVLGCRDLSRVDFIVGDEANPDALTLLEVNSLPGMTETSLYPEAAAMAGFPMPRWCDALVRRAHARGSTRRLEARPLPL